METPGRLERRDSQQTLISLLQLDPSPIDTPPRFPTEDKELPPLPPDAPDAALGPPKAGSTTGAPGLASGRGAIYYLTRVQRYSSYAVSIFTSLHLANVSLIPLATRSVAGSETYLLMTREIYQTSLTEPLLVALPVVAHIGSGLALRLLRRWQNMRRYGGGTPGMYALHRRIQHDTRPGSTGVRLWPPMSYISLTGYVFALAYAAHVFMNRLLPLAVDGDSADIGLAYVAHGFARHPGLSLVAYLSLVGAGCGHMVWGMARWFGLAPSTRWWAGRESVLVDGKEKSRRRRRWMGIHGASLALAAIWAAGGLGVVARGGAAQGWIATAYDNLLARARL